MLSDPVLLRDEYRLSFQHYETAFRRFTTVHERVLAALTEVSPEPPAFVIWPPDSNGYPIPLEPGLTCCTFELAQRCLRDLVQRSIRANGVLTDLDLLAFLRRFPFVGYRAVGVEDVLSRIRASVAVMSGDSATVTVDPASSLLFPAYQSWPPTEFGHPIPLDPNLTCLCFSQERAALRALGLRAHLHADGEVPDLTLLDHALQWPFLRYNCRSATQLLERLRAALRHPPVSVGLRGGRTGEPLGNSGTARSSPPVSAARVVPRPSLSASEVLPAPGAGGCSPTVSSSCDSGCFPLLPPESLALCPLPVPFDDPPVCEEMGCGASPALSRPSLDCEPGPSGPPRPPSFAVCEEATLVSARSRPPAFRRLPRRPGCLTIVVDGCARYYRKRDVVGSIPEFASALERGYHGDVVWEDCHVEE